MNKFYKEMLTAILNLYLQIMCSLMLKFGDRTTFPGHFCSSRTFCYHLVSSEYDTAIMWLKYCPYGVKHYPINQTEYDKI